MRALLIALAFLVGCTTIGHKPAPVDRPYLTTTIHKLDLLPLIAKCYVAVPLWMKLLGSFANGCAFIDLRQMRCDIYVHTNADETDPAYVHELDHCKLRDHIGSSMLSDLWNNWKYAQMRDGATYCYILHNGKPICVNMAVKIK